MDKKQLFELIGEASETYVTEEPVISKNNYFSGRKKMIAVIAAAALLIALGISAGAKYYFSLPKDLEENLHLESVDITSFAEDGIMPQGKTVSTCGYLVTFRALARGDRLNDIVMGLGDGSNIVKSREETFAIFTLEKEDGGAIDFDISDLSYIITMRGYEPNSLMFQQFKAATAENNVIYFACSVTDAVPFADHELGIVLTQESPVDGFVMRMDENGNAYFMPGYTGIAAQFSLPLDPAEADPEWQKKYMQGRAFNTEPDYSEVDRIMRIDAEYEENGPDLSEYIGDNKWRGSYPLQFGAVEYAEEFLSRRGEWKNKDVRALTFDEAQSYQDKRAPLPEDASSFDLADGSVCYYMKWNVFLLVGPDGAPNTVFAPSAHVIFRFTQPDNCVNALYMELTKPDSAISGSEYYSFFIDGIPAKEIEFDASVWTQEEIMEAYEQFAGECETVQDGVYQLALYNSTHEGIVQVIL